MWSFMRRAAFFMGSDGFFPSLGEKVEAFFKFWEEGLPDLQIGMGFIAHHERKGGGIGDGVGDSIV